jgi:hypothetical protein
MSSRTAAARGSPFDAEWNRADAYGPCPDSKDKNVSRLDRGERTPVGCAACGKGRVIDADFRERVARHPSFTLSEFFEIKLLAVIVINNVDRVLTAPNLKVCDRC